jgi:hypothetical protein
MNSAQIGTPHLPIKCKLTLLYAFSLVIAALVAAASIAGLLYPEMIYPDEDLLQSFMPNDVVHLVIGLPILLGSILLTWRGKLIGLLFWPGALFFIFYTYIVYVLSMPLNWAAMSHITLVTLSAYTMVALLASIDAAAVQQLLTGAVPARAGGGVLTGLGILVFVRVVVMFGSTITNQAAISPTEFALNVVDFMIAPAWILGGLLLWRKQALGYVIGLGLLFQASMLFIGLVFLIIFAPFISTAQFVLSDVLVVLVMGLVCFIPFGLFVRGVLSKANLASQ